MGLNPIHKRKLPKRTRTKDKNIDKNIFLDKQFSHHYIEIALSLKTGLGRSKFLGK